MKPLAAQGKVDGVYGNTMYGWARYLDGTERVEVRIYHANRLIGSVVADHYRSDLETAELGDGRHAFSWEIPETYRNSRFYTFFVKTAEGVFIDRCLFSTSEAGPQPENIVNRMPSRQNAVDVFAGAWLNRIPNPDGGFFTSGELPLFTDDHRVRWAAEVFGDSLGGLKGKKILELGPMEGHHTWQLERMGGEVIAIEGNANCYLKCLVIKEVLDMKAKFFAGDFLQYLELPGMSFDLVMASGVLYHMVNPIELISLISARTDNVFIWTHYWEEGASGDGWSAERVGFGGYECIGYRRYYGTGDHGLPGYMGGQGAWSVWLPRDSIFEALSHFGLGEITLHAVDHQSKEGPSMSFSASVARTEDRRRQ